MNLEAFEDPNHEGNSKKYHSGNPCITPDCDRPAGTLWSHLWCFECNVQRMRKITRNLEKMAGEFE
ncbi:TPA: hypothetical protein L3N15_004128 [Vibrio parahaemolyticus]|nr:hypothetical protein C1T06_23175 [Vibrio parahaemolyticus]HBN6266147.1 hypothetical protein [Vibrio parahaemolyticus]